jgi:hypothetical protein
MENVMTKGFCELNENEMMMVDGGCSAQTRAKNAARAYVIMIDNYMSSPYADRVPQASIQYAEQLRNEYGWKY